MQPGHVLITGITRCGKSRLSKTVIIPSHRRIRRWCGVLDPVGAPDWGADWVTQDVERFVEASRNSRDCVWFIDEVAKYRQNYKEICGLEEMAFMSGNRGHMCYFIAQRLMMVPPNIREQCSTAIVFQQAPSSLALLAEQFNQPRIMEVKDFPKGTAMVCEPFAEPRVIKLF